MRSMVDAVPGPVVVLEGRRVEVHRAQALGPECGTRVFARSAEPQPPRYNLRVGTIRQRRDLRPQKQMWCGSALDWVMDLRALKQYPKEP